MVSQDIVSVSLNVSTAECSSSSCIIAASFAGIDEVASFAGIDEVASFAGIDEVSSFAGINEVASFAGGTSSTKSFKWTDCDGVFTLLT